MSKNKKLYWQLPVIVIVVVGALLISHNIETPYQHDQGFVFGTVYHITYQSKENLKDSIEAELKKVDNSLSMFNSKSTISRFNNGTSISLDDDSMFADVFVKAMKISKTTGGAFDITIAPLVNAWGFGFKSKKMPSAKQVDSLRQFIGYQRIRYATRNGKRYIEKSDPRMMLDCSAIAKGYGSDVVARFLRKKGIHNFMIEIGGEIVASGVSEKRVPWKIGVTKPTDDSLAENEELQTVLNVTDIAMATSGNYRNFYYNGGKKYAHTIDPHTGRPVQHNILSSTVLAHDCATADAFATSFMVTGLSGAQKILKKHPELMVYFIYSDEKGKNQVWFSKKMREKILSNQN